MAGDPKTEARLARKAKRQELRRRAILEKALEALLDGGSDAFTIARVAERCALTKPAVYYYFSTREELVGELAVLLIQRESETILEAVEPVEGGVASLLAMVRARARSYTLDTAAFRALWNTVLQLGPGSEETLQRVYRLSWRVNALLEARLKADQEAGHVHPDAHPRKLVNVAFFGIQGILTTFSGMEQFGGRMLFGLETLVDELCATLERACRP